MKYLFPSTRVPKEYQSEFSTSLNIGNADRATLILVILAIYEAIIFLYEYFVINDHAQYHGAMIAKLSVVIFAVIAIFIMQYTKQIKRYEYLKWEIYGLACIIFGIGIYNTLIIQHILSEITLFLIYTCIMTMVIRIRPMLSFPLFFGAWLALTFTLPLYQTDPTVLIWARINSLVFTSIAFIISYIMYSQACVIFVDRKRITEQNQRLTYLANHDFLTGMMNHKQINQELEQLKLSSKVNMQPLSIAVIDIDDFKLINDNFGHRQGDQVIKSVARFIHDHFDKSCLIGRYGGDEFLIIMPETTLDIAFSKCEQLVKKINRVDFSDISLSISCGVSQLNENNYHQFLESADFKMYESKKSGKNNISR